ncbi:fimbrial protein [Burkholderia ubonensis]|uniref:fimbrial protein n=1 Tax=Burkholderia ubonensis TaxID=101571 RepID=UPI0009B3424B|nr:fimbrial protein [Burkholderia ubonensis]
MNRSVLLFLLGAIFSTYSVSAFSYETACYKSDKPSTANSFHIISSGDYPAAVPAAGMPVGAVVWRSNEVSVQVTCERLTASSRPSTVRIAQDGNWFGVDGVYPGYAYNGTDYIFERSKWLATPYMLGPKVGDKVSFSLKFSVIFFRWGANEPKSGPIWESGLFIGLDVMAGEVAPYQGKLAVLVSNPGITIIDCGADVRISKNEIDFNEISAFRAINNAIAWQVPFEISSSRSCAGKFKVNATLKPLVSSSYTRGEFLVPLQNDSIGIRIRNQASGEIFPFNQKKELADLTSATSQTNRYVAEAVWQTDKPKLGRFEAGATLQIEYQ